MEFVLNGKFSNVGSGPRCGYAPFVYAAVCFIHRGESAINPEQEYGERLYLALKIHIWPHIVAKDRMRDSVLRIHCVQWRMRHAEVVMELLIR